LHEREDLKAGSRRAEAGLRKNLARFYV